MEIKPIFFGFIDHDIFPFKEDSIIKKINHQGIYGLLQGKERWYLWPGFCFFNFKKTKKYNLNFFPFPGLDTGGLNYYKIYKNLNRDFLFKIKEFCFDIEKIEKIQKIKDIDKNVQIVGNWVHLVKASNWNKKGKSKIYSISKIIEIINKNINILYIFLIQNFLIFEVIFQK